MLVPLDDWLAKSDLISLDDYPPALAAIYNYRGKQYAIPKDMDTIGLWYNKELFDAAGIPYPNADWTWDDFREAAIALTDEENQVWGFAAELSLQSGFGNTIYQAGGYVVNEDRTKAGLAEPEAIEGLEVLDRSDQRRQGVPQHGADDRYRADPPCSNLAGLPCTSPAPGTPYALTPTSTRRIG